MSVTATSVSSATPTRTASDDDDDDDGDGQSWSNYLYIVVIIAVVFILLGFFYQRRRRNLATSAAQRNRNRFQTFHRQYPSSQSRDLSAVHANNRVWRNLRAGPFSHHARYESARRPGTSSTTDRARVDLDEEVPPPYVVAEPERTLGRGPSARDTRNAAWTAHRRTRDDVNLNDLTTRNEGGLVNKPPGYEESGNLGRHG